MKPGLRLALLFAMLPVLLLPLLGLWFVGQMADLTRAERRESLNAAARNYAASLHERHDLLSEAATQRLLPSGIEPIAIDVLARASLDGSSNEWVGVARHRLVTTPQGDAPASTLAMQFAVARSQEQPDHLFMLIEARDERYVAVTTDEVTRRVLDGDRLIVMAGERADALDEVVTRLHSTREGWLAELALPAQSRFVRIEALDVDYQASRKLEAVATSPLLALTEPSLGGNAVERLRAAELESLWSNAIRGFERAGVRVGVYDREGRLLARLGSLAQPPTAAGGIFDRMAARLLTFVVGLSADFNAIDQNLSPLSSALTGLPAQQSLRVVERDGSPFWLTTSAHPIWYDDRVAGALVLEQGDGSDLATGQSALQWLALLAAAAILLTAFAVFTLTSLTVNRIVRLRQVADAAIDARGRVVGSIPRLRWQDEVGALALGYERVLERLREHQQYLANLRARLVHELRTPIMVVRSSLENLSDHDNAYVNRALGGTVRLEKIVASMSEAASLESMMADSQLERVDLAALLRSLADAYSSAWSQHPSALRFELALHVEPAWAMVLPEPIAQALDKLVANAVDFASPGSAIVLELASADDLAPTFRTGPGFVLAVRNIGRPLPDQMTESLFESMVSVRDPGARDQSHLGLGLYLVRLIAEFHGGVAFAENTGAGVRVGFSVSAGLFDPFPAKDNERA